MEQRSKLEFLFSNMLDGCRPVSSGRVLVYLGGKSNLVVWSHLEFVFTDNLHI